MLAILLAEAPNFFSKAFKADIADEIPLIMAVLLIRQSLRNSSVTCVSPNEKTHSSYERTGFGIEFITSLVAPLPIIVGPVALRPSLSRSLPLSQPSYLINLSVRNSKNFRKILY
jgi:hypothetical protein